jgi:hypothetical protein
MRPKVGSLQRAVEATDRAIAKLRELKWATPRRSSATAWPLRRRRLIDGTSQRVALEATKFSLGVAGIRPPPDNVSVNIGIELKAGYVIDLSEPGQRAEKIVGGQMAGREAGGVIDNFHN